MADFPLPGVLEKFLTDLGDKPARVYLTNGVKLEGQIEHYDQEAILLTSSAHNRQVVFRRNCSTIQPL